MKITPASPETGVIPFSPLPGREQAHAAGFFFLYCILFFLKTVQMGNHTFPDETSYAIILNWLSLCRRVFSRKYGPDAAGAAPVGSKELDVVKRKIAAMLPVLLMLFLSSCGLLPREEAYRAAPVVRTYEREEFQLATAARNDMVLSTEVKCTYVPIQSETLSFPVGGIYIDQYFVELGDTVEKGQLLAQLNLEGVEDGLEECTRRLEELDMQLQFLEENRGYALERTRIQMRRRSEEDREEALEQVNVQYDLQKQSLEDERYLTELQKQEYEKRKAERQIYAGISGTVTYLRGFTSGERSVAGRPVVTISDSTMSLFRSVTPLWDRFSAGQEYVITVRAAEYEAVVTTEKELGLPISEKKKGEPGNVYFVLKTPTFDLDGGDQGTLSLILETRTDVLTVPESAVTTAGEQTIVYYMDENGMKAYKPIEAGLHAEGQVEVLSGLVDGESVIVN